MPDSPLLQLGRMLGLWLAIFWLAGSEARGEDPQRPNLVIMLCDDLGYGDLSCYGNPIIMTPHLDQLAAEGIRLTDCYSAAPVCSPARAGLLTGKTPSRIGVYDYIPGEHSMHLRANEFTLAKMLQAAGYATCHVGKWHLNGKFNSAVQPQPHDHGFDYWMSTQAKATPSHANPSNFVRNGEKVGPTRGYACDIVATEAIDWIREKRPENKPFFQLVCFHEPHEPVASPPDLVEQYKSAEKVAGQADYYANVANLDRAVGKLMQALDELKLADSTLVFFSSDNGPETHLRYPSAGTSHGSSGPLRHRKLHIYDGGIRVPGIVRWKGTIDAGQTVSEPICSLDLLPTIARLSGGKIPEHEILDGEEVSKILLAENDQLRPQRTKPIFFHYLRALSTPTAALRSGNYMIVGKPNVKNASGVKSIDSYKESSLTSLELYDLSRDIGQTTDLAKTEPKLLEELSAQLIAKYDEVKTEGPRWPEPSKPASKKSKTP